MFMGIGILVLEAALDKFFNGPAMRVSLEVDVAFSSLGNPCKKKKDK
jgi:hypothetical protein